MAQRLRLHTDDADWTADLGANGVELSGVDRPIAVRDEGDGRFVVEHDHGAERGVAAMAGDVVWVSVDQYLFAFTVGSAARSADRGHDALTPPMPATVVRIAVKPGDVVRTNDPLVVLEAMKMELPIRAPHDGVIAAVHCREGEMVQPGTLLVEFAS